MAVKRNVYLKMKSLLEAREIFEVHLPATVPFASNGHPATEMREEVIEQALSRLFDPNADNQVCRPGSRFSGTKRSQRPAVLMCSKARIETAEEADVCMRLGFTHAQGHHFGRPRPIAEV